MVSLSPTLKKTEKGINFYSILGESNGPVQQTVTPCMMYLEIPQDFYPEALGLK